MTELYTHDEMTCVMSHIEKSFGSVTNILHEIVSLFVRMSFQEH